MHAYRWLLQVAEALEYLHQNGVVHCCIKAENCVLNDLLVDQTVVGARWPAFSKPWPSSAHTGTRQSTQAPTHPLPPTCPQACPMSGAWPPNPDPQTLTPKL